MFNIVLVHPEIPPAAILREIARAHHAQGDEEAALDCIEAAIAAADARGDEGNAGRALNVQALVLWQRGDLDDEAALQLGSLLDLEPSDPAAGQRQRRMDDDAGPCGGKDNRQC